MASLAGPQGERVNVADARSISDHRLDPDDYAKLRDFRDRVQQAVGGVVVGMEHVVEQLLVALVAKGHVLLEGVPGVAKTTLAKAFAAVLGLDHHRVQFTPDLLPSDVTGTYVLDRRTNEFELRQGPIFCQVLLADEVNRAPAKTQSALLEAMQEWQTTIEGKTLPLPTPFMVLATQNPVEQEGVYRLPEAQLDRFLVRVQMDYPTRETEIGILKLHGGLREPGDNGASTQRPPPTLPTSQFNAGVIQEMQQMLNGVYAEPSLVQYIVDLARSSRQHPDVGLGASPRASLYLLQAARARALLGGRHYATHEDVQSMAMSVLGHRLILRAEAEIEGRDVETVVNELLSRQPVLR
jgi:MoxR-like ATPase